MSMEQNIKFVLILELSRYYSYSAIETYYVNILLL